jgi:O-antigen/teichoic acid export membrane protein
MMHRRKLADRFAFGFLDQAVISLGSLLYIIGAAQSFNAVALGQFSFLLATLLLSTSVIRSFCGENFLISKWENRTSSGRSMLATSVLSSLLLSCVFLVVSFFWVDQRTSFIAIAICTPVFIYADGLRYFLIGTTQDGRLFFSDALVVILNFLTIYISAAVYGSPIVSLVAWTISTASIATLASICYRIGPAFPSAVRWIRAHWSSGSAFTVEALIGALLGYLIVVILAAVSNVEEVAAFRTTMSIFGLTSLIINFLKTTVLREISRGSEVRKPMQVSALMTAIAVLAVLVVPDSVGSRFFGDAWLLVTPLIAVAAINRFAASLSAIPSVLLRAIGVTWKATVVRIWVGFVALALGPVGALYAGAWGAFAAEAFAYLILTVALFVVYRINLVRDT